MIDFDESRQMALSLWPRLNRDPFCDGLPDEVLAWALAIQAIPAPTFDEAARADYVAGQFNALGLRDVVIDERFNVYGRLAASSFRTGAAVMVVAHTDTVFPAATDLTIREAGEDIYGPGLGDNSLGVAGLLGVAAGLRRLGIPLRRDVWFVATSREEGLGDLGGMRMAFERLRGEVSAVVNIEGMAYGHVYHEGIAVRRLHIVAQAEGGHSWAHYGNASAIHGLMRLGAAIAEINPPQKPRTTLNIGVIGGGQSVNTIASHAEMWLDMRSETAAELRKLEESVRRHIKQMTADDLAFRVDVVGDRPAGRIPAEHGLVRLALDVLDRMGVRGTLATGSTDGNIPLAAGCPTVTLGVTRGSNAHRIDEYIERAPIADGVRQLLCVVAALTVDSTG